MAFITDDPWRNAVKLREIRSTFEKMGVVATADSVTVCGQIIHRPSWLSPSQWLDHWEIAR